MRILVTRPQAQADALVAELRRAGIDAKALPLIDIAPVADPQPLIQAWQGLPSLALVMFVSANAVQHFMQARPPGATWPAAVLAGSTGPGTSAALRAAGVTESALVEPLGEVFDSEALWARLSGRDWQARRVLVVRGEDGRDWLAEQLSEAGAQVEFIAAYCRVRPEPGPVWRARRDAALARPADYLWVLSSSEAVANLQQLSPGADWSSSRAVAPHPRIVAALQRLGFAQVRLAAVGASALQSLLREERPIQSRAQ
jgi:uroporphyrinogen-III synthase